MDTGEETMLEKMNEFFDRRVDTYDEHMRANVEGEDKFYDFTAAHLPKAGTILDLGCGTGLELESYYALGGEARVTGIDLSEGMLDALEKKFPDKELRLLRGSYFDLPFGEACFDAAVSVESLHHFTAERKTGLYRKLHAALQDGGYFILTDYFCETDEQEAFFFRELARLKKEEGIAEGDFYHYDTPLTPAHETEALRAAGFSRVEILRSWDVTHTIRAEK